MKTIESTPRPKTFRNWKGEPVPAVYPNGIELARCGDVFLIRTGETFAVVYGLQVKAKLPRDSAAAEFGSCVFHQSECAGLLD